MNIQIQKIEPAAILPNYAHPGDAGMDLYSVESVVIAPGERVRVRTGIALAVPTGYVGLVWDKSGRAITDGITTLAGVIDSGYRGEVEVVLLNTSQQEVRIASGEKIAQLLIQPIIQAIIEEVSTLERTHRGADGFGSTGIT